jgi:hypothetical protein
MGVVENDILVANLIKGLQEASVRIEALEAVLSSVLPDFNKDTVADFIKMRREAEDKHIKENLVNWMPPIVLSGSVIGGATAHIEGLTCPVNALSLQLVVGNMATNCTIKLPVLLTKTQIVY